MPVILKAVTSNELGEPEFHFSVIGFEHNEALTGTLTIRELDFIRKRALDSSMARMAEAIMAAPDPKKLIGQSFVYNGLGS